MTKLFVDTNAFHKLGYNFDEQNPVINALIKTVIDNKYEYNNLSVIDNEIKSHLKDRGKEQKSLTNKMKWISKLLDTDIIDKNCYKDLNDYLNFKERINAVNCDVSSINPEDVFEKYFNIELPFESSTDKRKEFPDAFIAAYINNLKTSEKDHIYFITDDKGLSKSITNVNAVIYTDIISFLEEINNISPIEQNKVFTYIKENICSIEEGLLANACINTNDLENEEVSLDSLTIQNISDIQVIDKDENSFVINCICDCLVLKGEFITLDYYNSYMPNDCDFYVSEEYLRVTEIPLMKYEFIITIKKYEDEYRIEFANSYKMELYFDLLSDAYVEMAEHYIESHLEDYDFHMNR